MADTDTTQTAAPSTPAAPDLAIAAAAKAKADADAKAAADQKAADDAKAAEEAAAREAAKPTIVGLNPGTGVSGQIIEITGTNFGEATEDGADAAYTTQEELDAARKMGARATKRRKDASVLVNGVVVTHISEWSPNTIKIHVPIMPIGIGSITVRVPEGEASKPFEVVR